jgi:hypothetical protein
MVGRLAARPRLAPTILGGVAFYCLPTALLVVVHQPGVAFGLQVVRGAGTLVVDTLAITALQRSAPKEMVARVFGAFFALTYGALSLGALIRPLSCMSGCMWRCSPSELASRPCACSRCRACCGRTGSRPCGP